MLGRPGLNTAGPTNPADRRIFDLLEFCATVGSMMIDDDEAATYDDDEDDDDDDGDDDDAVYTGFRCILTA